MWIVDTSVERAWIALWGPGCAVERVSCPQSFLLTLTDPVRHWELVEALDAEFGAVPVRTIHGENPGWRINAGKEVAAAVLRQTDHGAQCYNVDVRRDHRSDPSQSMHLSIEGRSGEYHGTDRINRIGA